VSSPAMVAPVPSASSARQADVLYFIVRACFGMLLLFYGTDFQGNENKIGTLELCCESVKKRLTYMIKCYIISTFLTENPIFWLKNNSNRRKMK
jgi:hypothetical protein